MGDLVAPGGGPGCARSYWPEGGTPARSSTKGDGAASMRRSQTMWCRCLGAAGHLTSSTSGRPAGSTRFARAGNWRSAGECGDLSRAPSALGRWLRPGGFLGCRTARDSMVGTFDLTNRQEPPPGGPHSNMPQEPL